MPRRKQTEGEKKIDISQMAEDLGVSKTTVSRALSGNGRVSEATRARVVQYAKEKNYVPNMLARGLVTQQSYNISLVFSRQFGNLAAPFLRKTVSAVYDIAARNDYDVLMTMVGEPQNLIIAKAAGWHFGDFFLRMAPVSVPVLICGLATCLLVEKFRLFGYGAQLPEPVRQELHKFDLQSRRQRTRQETLRLIAQGIIGVWLIAALAFHLAEVGLIGLSVIILATTFTGVTDEHAIGKAFTEALPFTALLAVFFAVVAVIIDQHLFAPIIAFVLRASPDAQLSLFYLFNGLLSSISDNVFVGTVYINEAKTAMEQGVISAGQFELLAVAINTGTNLPSVATPNGQAAFLFLLTSALAPLIRLSYGRMVWMALPYTLVLTIVGLLCVKITLIPCTQWLIQAGILAAQ